MQVFLRSGAKSKSVAQMLRQHRNGAIDEIDRGGALLCFLVDNRAGAHVMGHVGNMHAHLPIAVRHPANRQSIVEIFGIARVDGERRHPLKSSRIATSSGVIPASIRLAASSTFFG